MGSSKEAFNALREQEEANVETGLSLELKSLIQAKKSDIENISKAIVQQVADGNVDAFKAYCHNKKIKELADLNDANLRPFIKSKGIPKAGLTMFNIAFTAKSDAATWDYSECNDPEYTSMLAQMKELKEKIKKKETVLQNMDKEEERVDTTTGETYTVYPASKITGAENFAASFK
jgi:hypothetical protein